MSLITRCPACDTMFKVVADQLKIAQGWVRCGHCAHIFDASAQLQVQETAQTGSKPAEPSLQTGALDELRTHFETRQAQHDALREPAPENSPGLSVGPALPEKHFLPDEEPAPHDVWAPPAAVDTTDEVDFDPAGWRLAQQQLASGRVSQDASEALLAPVSQSSAAVDFPVGEPELAKAVEIDFENSSLDPHPDSESSGPDAEIVPEVSFVRDARRRAFWQRPLVRGFLVLLLLALSAGLMVQWTLQNKDRLAVLEPRLVPVLQALCVPWACKLKLPRQVESLVIDSSTFNKLSIDTYRLDFVLKNNGPILLEVPSLELTLTDNRDQAIVRRVLKPSQFGVSVATLSAHSELAGTVSLKVLPGGASAGAASGTAILAAPLPVAGYRILAFYP